MKNLLVSAPSNKDFATFKLSNLQSTGRFSSDYLIYSSYYYLAKKYPKKYPFYCSSLGSPVGSAAPPASYYY